MVSSTCLLRRAHWVRRNLTLSLLASTDLFRRAVFYEGGGVSATHPRAQAFDFGCLHLKGLWVHVKARKIDRQDALPPEAANRFAEEAPALGLEQCWTRHSRGSFRRDVLHVGMLYRSRHLQPLLFWRRALKSVENVGREVLVG